MSAPKKKMPRWCWRLMKIGVAGGIVAWMFSHDIIRFGELKTALANWHLLVAALAALFVGIFLQSIRWGILLRAQGLRAGTWELFNLTITGLFFGLVGPGGIGGDAAKAICLARGREKKTEAATTVLLDRCLGLATLLLVGAVAVGLKASWLWDENVEGLNHFGLPGGRILVITIVAGVVLILAFALLVTNKRVRGSQRLSRLLRGVPFRRTLVRVYDAMHLYGDKPGALVRAAAVSIAAQVPLYAIYYLCGRAVGADIELWHCALIVPPAMVIRVLPLMPAGAGQGMVAMGVLFKLVKIKQGAAIGAVGDVMFLAACLIGGLFFVFGKTDYNDMRAAAEPDAESEPGAQ